MYVIANPYRGTGRLDPAPDIPFPSSDHATPRAMLTRCPKAAVTPLLPSPALGHARLDIKDERGRMGLGSFKALGAAYVIACDAAKGDARGRSYVTASAGNHGLSVAAGASAFEAEAIVYIAETVPESFADKLRGLGATVTREGAVYEESMAAAAQAAQARGWTLLSDSSWGGYTAAPHRLMEGYTALMGEVFDQIEAPPTHIFLQAGVGGLAAACAASARAEWGDNPFITVVEPEAAPALQASIEAGRAVISRGPVSSMGRLDCKEPSLIALKGLARDADAFATLSEAEAQHGTAQLAAMGLESSPSGAAGLVAALLTDLPAEARVLCILSEGP